MHAAAPRIGPRRRCVSAAHGTELDPTSFMIDEGRESSDLEREGLRKRLLNIEDELRATIPEIQLTSDAPPMRAAVEVAARAAAHAVPVLLRGESGTGKGALARALHALSPRSAGPFGTVSCVAPPAVLSSDLFGMSRRAAADAGRDTMGHIDAARGGTLFFDEVGALSLPLQAKILRLLVESRFERLGEGRSRKADVRIVAATTHDLEDDVAAGRFRGDVLFRLNVVEIRVPPLRERQEDILELAGRFLTQFARSARREPPALSASAQQALAAYRWPGNLRELRNTIERALILCQGSVIDVDALPERMVGGVLTGAPGASAS